MVWTLMSAVLGAVLLLAGVPKLRAPEQMVAAVRGYRLLPGPLERPVALALPYAEVALSALLLVGLTPRAVPIAATALFLAFLTGLTVNLLRGRRDLDCGCFAFGGADRAPRIGWAHAGRALLFAAAAALLAAVPGGYGLGVTPAAEHLLGLALAVPVVAAGVAAAVLRTVVQPGPRAVDTHLAGARHQLRVLRTTSS